MRQRVAAAFGSPAWLLFLSRLRQRRMTSAVTPLSPAQSCRRREALSESRVTSPTTPARPLHFKPFFHRGKNVAVLPGLAKDHAIGMQTDARERRRKQIAAAQTPEHRSLQAREDAGDEQCGKSGNIGSPRRPRSLHADGRAATRPAADAHRSRPRQTAAPPRPPAMRSPCAPGKRRKSAIVDCGLASAIQRAFQRGLNVPILFSLAPEVNAVEESL